MSQLSSTCERTYTRENPTNVNNAVKPTEDIQFLTNRDSYRGEKPSCMYGMWENFQVVSEFSKDMRELTLERNPMNERMWESLQSYHFLPKVQKGLILNKTF